MAEEERGGIQNVWLLFIALGLGLVVVFIYNVHIYKVRQEQRGQSIRLLSVTRDMERGDKVGPDDLVVKTVPKQYEGTLGNVVPEGDLKFAIGTVVNDTIGKGQWLMWTHITEVNLQQRGCARAAGPPHRRAGRHPSPQRPGEHRGGACYPGLDAEAHADH
jgi:hypothetical protein